MEIKRPSEEHLRSLYLDQRKSTNEIAALFGVSNTSAKRWLKRYDIPRRPGGNTLANRGLRQPTAEELRHLVHVEHRPYAEVAAMFGATECAVHDWLDKHGIPRASIWMTRRRGFVPVLPTESELRQLYEIEGVSLKEIGAMHGVSEQPIANLCAEYGIEIRHHGFKGEHRVICKDGHQVRSSFERRVDDWLSDRGIEHAYEPRIPVDRRYAADFLANGWYIEIWGVDGVKSYREKRAKKLALYEAHGVPLIDLPTESFRHGATPSWEERLQQVLTPTSLRLLPSPKSEAA